MRLLAAGVRLAAVAALSISCASSTSPSKAAGAAHSPSAPSSPTARAASAPVLPHGRIPAALVGTYSYRLGGTWHTTLRPDGTYAQWNEHGELDITGRYGVVGHRAVFLDDQKGTYTGSPCDGPGVYTWSVAGAVLIMVEKQDGCTVGRQAQWTAHWRKISPSALPVAPTFVQAQGK